jgi:putative FmdB family regulatory protein
MILYEYRCKVCDEITEAVRDVDDRNNCPTCLCGGETKKIISSYRTHSDLTPYFDENLQTFIQGKQHRKKVMKEQGVSEHFGQNWYTSARKARKS